MVRRVELTVALVRQALARDRSAIRVIVDALTPVIQARAARALLRRGPRDVKAEVEDITQNVSARCSRGPVGAVRVVTPKLSDPRDFCTRGWSSIRGIQQLTCCRSGRRNKRHNPYCRALAGVATAVRWKADQRAQHRQQ